MTALTEPQRAAIRDGLAGIERDEIAFMSSAKSAGELKLHLAGRNSGVVIVTVGEVSNHAQIKQLIDYVSEYLAELYSAEGED